MARDLPRRGPFTPVQAPIGPEMGADTRQAPTAPLRAIWRSEDGRHVRASTGKLMRARRFKTELRKSYGHQPRLNVPIDAHLEAAIQTVMALKGCSRPQAGQHLMRMGAI